MTLSITMLCHYGKGRILFIVMLNVIMLSVVKPNVAILNVVMLSVVKLNVVLLSVIMLNVVAPSFGYRQSS